MMPNKLFFILLLCIISGIYSSDIEFDSDDGAHLQEPISWTNRLDRELVGFMKNSLKKRREFAMKPRSLHDAVCRCDLKEIEKLLHSNMQDINLKDQNGDTALLLACKQPVSRSEIIELLLFAEADPTIEDKSGVDALCNVACSSDIEKIKTVMTAIRPDKFKKYFRSSDVVCYAVKSKNIDTVELLLNFGASMRSYLHGLSVLDIAVDNNDSLMAEYLINKGFINAKLGYSGNRELQRAIMKNYPEMVKLLLQVGIDPNYDDCSFYKSHLMYAVEHKQKQTQQNIKIISMLLEYGADINYIFISDKNAAGIWANIFGIKLETTVLDMAQNNNHTEAIRLLKDKGAKNIKDLNERCCSIM